LRRPIFALSSALAAVGLSAGLARAQQQPSTAAGQSPSSSADAADSSMANRPARYLLRNGLDYLAYREYDRALSFFRSLETRQGELNDSERGQLKKGITQAQAGKREASNSPRVVAIRKGRSANPPGAFVLARPAAPEPVLLTGGSAPAPSDASAPAVALAAMPSAPATAPAATTAEVAEPAPLSPGPATGPAVAAPNDLDLPRLPAPPPQALPDLSAPPAPAADPATAPASVVAPAPPPLTLEPSPAQAPAAETPSALDLPTLPSLPAAAPVEAPPPAAVAAPSPAPAANPPALVAQGLPGMPAQPAGPVVPESPPAPEAGSLPPLPVDPSPRGDSGAVVSDLTRAASAGRDASDSLLSPGHREEVERIAQRPSDTMSADRGTPAVGDPNDPNALAAPVQGSTRLELPRAPSPTEARPLRRIPVPEEFVPIKRREWDPNRKYWAAAGTCHMTLYFQDPVLERYGQGVEQSLGPVGRFFSYPLDDPKQSNQRNQILQPFYSIGKFCFQVGTLPYKVLMDPPTEAEYDLGYYRPGDKIPTDTILITPTGVGPPLRGRRY